MRKDPTKEKLKLVQDLRSQGPSDDTVDTLQNLIQTQQGIVVGKAASLAAEWQVLKLAPTLRDAFYRLRKNGLEDDPQCWGKVALVKALFDLAWQEADVYLDGCQTVQLEPVYGGKEDSATPVRTASFAVLVQLAGVNTNLLMATLADLLADPSSRVRTEVARASVYCPPELTRPLLRLKIRLGDAEPRVLGTCFDALLGLAPYSDTIQLILEYVHADSNVLQAEALASLASSGCSEAVEAVRELYPSLTDPQLKRVLLTALGGSPTETALEFLLDTLEHAPLQEATWALEALKPKRYDETIWERVTARAQAREDDLAQILTRG